MEPPSNKWLHWQLVGLVAVIYALSFILPAALVPLRLGPTHIDGQMADPGGKPLPPLHLSGADAFVLAFRQGSLVWFANPALWIGCALLALRRLLWAGLAGLASLGLGSITYLQPEPGPDKTIYLAGYWTWLLSQLMLTLSGMLGWHRFRRDFPTALPPFKA